MNCSYGNDNTFPYKSIQAGTYINAKNDRLRLALASLALTQKGKHFVAGTRLRIVGSAIPFYSQIKFGRRSLGRADL